MAKYTITGPDGATYDVTAPDDATEAQVLEYVQRNMAATTNKEPAPRPGALERGAKGFIQGIRDPRDALSQGLTKFGAAIGVPGAKESADWWDKDIATREAAYQRDVRGGQKDTDFGRIAGTTAVLSPLAAAAPQTMLQAAGAGALTGALSGALQPVVENQENFAKEKAKQTLLGGGTGLAVGPVAQGLSRIIQPKVSPQVAALRAEGVTPTPGQVMGGLFKSAEEKLASVPLLGSAIKVGQERAVKQMNAAAINRSLAPIGEKLPKNVFGYEAIDYADDALHGAYKEALDAVGPLKLDPKINAAMDAIKNRLKVLPKEKAEQFERIIQAELGDRAVNQILPPEMMKAADSNLGRMAREYGREADFDTRQLGEAIGDAMGALRDLVQRQAPPGAADAVKAANTGWANFKRVQRAAAYAGTEEGVFTPAQLNSAVKASDPSRDKASFAKGGALMQDLSRNAKTVLGNKVPNSGTADRAMAFGLPAALLTGGATTGTLPLLGAAALPSLAYTPWGQRAAASMLAGNRGPVAGALSGLVRESAIPASIALTPAMYGLLNQ